MAETDAALDTQLEESSPRMWGHETNLQSHSILNFIEAPKVVSS